MAARTYMVIQFVDTLLRELQVGAVALKEGMCVGIDGSQKVVKANADPADTIVPAIGVVARSYQAHEKGCEIFTALRVGGVTGAVAGDLLYLSTDGAMQLTKPALVGWLVQKIGICYAAKKVRINVAMYDSVLIDGATIIVANGTTTAVGDLVGLDTGEVVLADASVGAVILPIGVADSIVVGDGILTVGVIFNLNEIEYQWTVIGATPGGAFFLSETEGEMTQTAPSDAGDIVMPVAYALSATVAQAAFDGGYNVVVTEFSPDYGWPVDALTEDIIVTTGVTTAVGDLVGLVSDKIVLANAATGTAIPAIGVALEVVEGNDALTCSILLNPNENEYEWTVSSHNIGIVVYLAETDGALTETRPSDAGDLIQVVGFSASATVVKAAFERSYEVAHA